MLVALTAGGCSFESGNNVGSNAGIGGSSGAADDSAGGDDPSTSGGGQSGGSSMGATTDEPTDPTDPTVDPTGATADPTDPTDPTDPRETSGDETTTGDPTGGESTGNTTSDETTGTRDGAAQLELSDDAFGDVWLGAAETANFTLENTGDGAATALAPSVDAPFTISNDDCGASLGAGSSCTITLAFDPDELGPVEGTLTVDYDAGEANESVSRTFDADVLGSTGNLLPDPGFESCGNIVAPNNDWLDTGPGDWLCYASGEFGVDAASGSRFVAANEGPDNANFNLRRSIDVSAFANAIQTGAMEFSVSARGRSFEEGNDQYRMRVRYRNAGGNELDTDNTGYQTSDTWSDLELSRQADIATAEIWIELGCRKSGGDFCDAYFDDVEIIGAYPGI